MHVAAKQVATARTTIFCLCDADSGTLDVTTLHALELLPRLFSVRDFPVQLAGHAAGPLQGGEFSSFSDLRTVYALLGPKIVKLASDRPDHVG
ncbi:hypothetical protein CA13_58210 [Planctomycetes bacterium CA13]|uniref:Uncharacterized protein n=1 Tax=Novipirellula herctigrandis TaxID=2527986 RepID=A0A5C5ZAH9_9BACT|nr:hypothetical protein CA13_58210 [Planctomycetes bacterium CA13]